MGRKPSVLLCVRRVAAGPLVECSKGACVLLVPVSSLYPSSPYSSIASSACTVAACQRSACCPAAVPALEMSVGRPAAFFVVTAGLSRGACGSPAVWLRSA